jgi:hypothetical protein
MNSRDKLREEINAILRQRNLREFERLGDSSKGQMEIIGISTRDDGTPAIYDDNAQFFTDITFDMKAPNGNEFKYKIRFNANGATSDGSAIVVLVNGKFVLVRQWRTPLGQYTMEPPRGFATALEKARNDGSLGNISLDDLPPNVRAILVRELGQPLLANASLFVRHLGVLAENSGTHAVKPSFFMVQLTIPEPGLQEALKVKQDSMAIKLWEPHKVFDELGEGIFDLHSVGAITLALKALRALPAW